MAAGSTYTPLATQTLASAAASVTFSSISGAYTDLILIVVPKATTGDYIRCRVGNGSVDTGSNYSDTYICGNGSAAFSARYSNITNFNIQIESLVSTTEFTSNNIIHFQNYANTTTYKTVLFRSNKAYSALEQGVGLWRSTSAINTISVLMAAQTFAIGSTFTLYGIAAA